jgi:hypothetical protein
MLVKNSSLFAMQISYQCHRHKVFEAVFLSVYNMNIYLLMEDHINHDNIRNVSLCENGSLESQV